MPKDSTTETKPLTSDALGQKPDRTVNVGGAPENKRDESGDQKVTVKALKTFHKDGDFKGEMCAPGDEFEVHRHRAAQLRANGLIEYADERDDHAIHGQVDAGRLAEKAKLQAEASKIPENSKGTPLRNPEVKLAAAPPESDKK